MHEMLFGFGMAAVAGFMLTAIPNWTGRLPLQGAPLTLLFALWLAGRGVGLGSAATGPGVAAAADLAFPALLLAVVVREIAAGRNWRNLPMVAALGLLLVANALMHAEALAFAETAMFGARLGLAVLLLLISLVGGRIIPSFTHNWLVKRGVGAALPASLGMLDRIALLLTALGLAAWVAVAPAIVTGPLLIAAGIAAAVRLARWRGDLTLPEPLLWVLHLGHAWLAVGLTLLGMSEVWSVVPASAAIHALTVGAIGTMTLAVMTRATLGHTGRVLTAGAGTTAIYVLITLAAASRVLASFMPESYMALLGVAAGAWIGAFGLFVLLYGPILLRPRAA